MMLQANSTEVKSADKLWKLPKGWEWKYLEDLVLVHDGSRKPVKKAERISGLIPYCGANGVIDSVASFTHEGDFVLLAEDGGFYKAGEKSAYLMKGRFWANNHVHILKGIDGILDNKWLLYALNFLDLQRYLAGATRPKLNQASMRRIAIPVPSIGLQHRIIDRIESLLVEVNISRELLESMRRDHNKLSGRTIQEVAESIPSDRQPLVNVLKAKPRNGWSPKCDGNPLGTPVLKLGAVLKFRYVPTEFKRTSEPTNADAHYWLEPGDILISRSNTPELVGHASIYSGEPYPCIYPDLIMRMNVNPDAADARFLLYWLQTQEVRDYIQSHASGASSTMKKITQSDVCNIPFPIIDVTTQRQLAAYLDGIQNEVDYISEILDEDAKLLDRLEQSILEQAFQGKL